MNNFTRIYAIWTSSDGIYTAILDTQEELDELLEEGDIEWLDDWAIFDWQRAYNGMMIQGGKVFTP